MQSMLYFLLLFANNLLFLPAACGMVRALFSVGLLLTPRWFVDASLFRSAVSCCVADETVREKEAALNSHGTENKQISKPFNVCSTHVNSCATESAQHTSHEYKGLWFQCSHIRSNLTILCPRNLL